MAANADFRDTIATVDEQGKRRWIFPKKPKGDYYRYRTWVSYGLLLILFGLPFIKVNGEPLILLNVLERHFILFGLAFTPQDFHLFAILMITGVVFIALFTVVFGRLFCGWVCPQTIFMEMVFRKVEYWIEGDANAQRKLAKAPWTSDKIRKKALKHAIFLVISALIAHVFLAYIIGMDAVLETVSQSPLAAPGGFAAIIIFIGVFYFVFSYMREQVCIAICPYGRLQGVLLDDNSINVIYDYERGEPRGKIRKGKPKRTSCSDCENCRDGKDGCADQILNRINHAITTGAESMPLASAPLAVVKEKKVGDCIDCTLCVQVCPTGIDIRNGIQMECVNCTACIDACDEVMIKVGRDPGLIRYDSERGVAAGKRKIWTPRVLAYSAVLLLLIGLNVFLLSGRTQLDALLLRAPGQLSQTNADGSVGNLYTYQLINKSRKELPVRFEVERPAGGKIRYVGENPTARPGEVSEGALFIDLPPDVSRRSDNEVYIKVYSEDRLLDELTTSFLYPESN
ncbi:cytochrome c oxidase accessory protein CcoG [Lewinellaceae bacterium SD302]|nr:cytochrome c oxidase accessory protein CcoG [Lewinellaceae bacterium SD302]